MISAAGPILAPTDAGIPVLERISREAAAEAVSFFGDAIGTQLPLGDVCDPVATGDKPDMARTAQFGRD